MKANKTINLSTKTNLLEQDLYEYKLQDVSQPELFREIFPYNEVPKVSYNYRHVPMDMPEHIYITDTSFRDGQQSREPYTTQQMVDLYKMLHRLAAQMALFARLSSLFIRRRIAMHWKDVWSLAISFLRLPHGFVQPRTTLNW